MKDITKAAKEAVERGYVPVPIHHRSKNPFVSHWTKLDWEDKDVAGQFDEWADKGADNIGLVLGEASGGLVDIDLDNSTARRLSSLFLPKTAMMHGRESSPRSHYWYKVTDELPGTRRYKMPDKSVSVELRSTRSQTIIPPSIHPTEEEYRWEGKPWGGKKGPTEISGRVLSVRVASLALVTILADHWPVQGSRHEAYLALAGGLLRYGDSNRVHPFWEQSLPSLIGALAEGTFDEDGADSRIKETIPTTIERINRGDKVTGFGFLSSIIGEPALRQTKSMVREIAGLAGFEGESPIYVGDSEVSDSGDIVQVLDSEKSEAEEDKDPLSRRITSWEQVNLEPYLAGEVVPPKPDIFLRSDGRGLMYSGRINMLYGPSESVKSWIALYISMTEISKGSRVVYLDFEDEPVNTLDRLLTMGASPDDIRFGFAYVRPEEPIEALQRNRWGEMRPSPSGRMNQAEFDRMNDRLDPSVIVVDGMTVLYGLHGLETNDATSTDMITGWLKSLTRNGMTTVIVIDHTVKNPVRGSLPLGSGHKKAMVQGTMLQVWPVTRPRRGAVGKVDLIVMKDRLGSVREVSPDGKVQVAAQLVMDSRIAGTTTMTINEPARTLADQERLDIETSKAAKKAAEAQEHEERVLMLFEGELDREMTMREFKADSGLGPTMCRNAVKRLIRKGWLVRTGSTQDTRFQLQVGGAGFEPIKEEEDNVDA